VASTKSSVSSSSLSNERRTFGWAMARADSLRQLTRYQQLTRQHTVTPWIEVPVFAAHLSTNSSRFSFTLNSL
jgi:hypothetical protein